MGKFSNVLAAAIFAAIIVPTALSADEYGLEECKAKAAEGSAEAQWQLGRRLENGEGVKKNIVRALVQYKKAAEQRHRKACERLAELYENGRLVKRDVVLAAKYRAWAAGENGELAVAKAKSDAENAKHDEIEIALDYILGRNGKPKDPKAGIRILYQSAKEKPIAQKVFVDRWSRGDLDDALEVLSYDEWEKLIPWYKDAWDRGNRRTGLVLGNDAYRRKAYISALSYWQKSGMAKCWYRIGMFYNPAIETRYGGGPDNMKDETKSRQAYERCLRIDSSWDEAKYDLGRLYLFAERKENVNLLEAKRIFSYFLKKSPDNMWYNYYYGLSGCWFEQSRFNTKWPMSKVDSLISWGKSHDGRAYLNVSGREQQMLKDYNQLGEDYQNLMKSKKLYVSYISKAADLGCEPAKEYMSDYNSKNSN